MTDYIPFILAVAFTLGISAFCSLLEAMILSTTTAEVESLKQKHPRKGHLLESFKLNIAETSSAILSLNTVANTLGATVCGVLAANLFTPASPVAKYVVPLGLTVAILILSEVLPKNIAVLYRPTIQPHLVYPLAGVRALMSPVSWLCNKIVQAVTGKRQSVEGGDEEIILLAEKSAKDGTLTEDESAIISNTLRMDEVKVADIMTPRTVVEALDKNQTIRELFEKLNNIPFARLPVYEESIDHIVGMVRRRDLLKAKAADEDSRLVGDFMQDVMFIPENVSGANALKGFLENHQQLAVVVDEFGSTAGVITMEDVIEHILGQEIFEKDDVAIDMRELARRKKISSAQNKARWHK